MNVASRLSTFSEQEIGKDEIKANAATFILRMIRDARIKEFFAKQRELMYIRSCDRGGNWRRCSATFAQEITVMESMQLLGKASVNDILRRVNENDV